MAKRQGDRGDQLRPFEEPVDTGRGALGQEEHQPGQQVAGRQAAVQDAMEEIKSQLDSLSEMGEMESLRLQMAMDRLSKLMSTLSNLLKKISDTQSSIVANLK